MRKPTKFQKDQPEIRPPKVQHIRGLKPEFFVHEGVSEMSVNARYAELGLWTCYDWHGRFEWRPKTFKLRIMPFDDVDFEVLMSEWVKYGFVDQYEVDGQEYGRVLNWEKHQAINRREKDGNVVCPAPPLHIQDRCAPVPARAVSAGVGVDVGSNNGSGFDAEHGDGHSSYQPTQDRKNDVSYRSATETDLALVSNAFREKAEAPFKAGDEQRPRLATLIGEHGLDVMCEAARVLAEEHGHDWAAVWCPAALLLCRTDFYIQEAKARLAIDRKLANRQETRVGVH